MKYTTLGLAIVLLAMSGGCSGFTDLAIEARNHSAAYKAWKTARWTYWEQGIPCTMREHIGRGFQQGYYDVANGGTGKLPLFPPGYYWGPEYQNPRGNEYVAAWFRGYTDGALAADAAGIGGYHALPTSWAPPYANDPDSPDGGFSPYKPRGGIPGAATPGDGIPPPRLEGIPPGSLNTPPQLPLPPATPPKSPAPLPKSVNVPVPPSLPLQDAGSLQPADATQLETPAPKLNAAGAEAKTEATEAPVPTAKTPAGKQTFLPPGSPKPPLTSEPKAVPQFGQTPGEKVKK